MVVLVFVAYLVFSRQSNYTTLCTNKDLAKAKNDWEKAFAQFIHAGKIGSSAGKIEELKDKQIQARQKYDRIQDLIVYKSEELDQ